MSCLVRGHIARRFVSMAAWFSSDLGPVPQQNENVENKFMVVDATALHNNVILSIRSDSYAD